MVWLHGDGVGGGERTHDIEIYELKLSVCWMEEEVEEETALLKAVSAARVCVLCVWGAEPTQLI